MVDGVKIVFPQSRSKFYRQIVNLASRFSNFSPGPLNTIIIKEKEIFEKWETFNSLFWKIVDWQGMYIEFNGSQWHSHEDKTRLFYALQEAHSKVFFFAEEKARQMYKVYRGNAEMNQADISQMPEADINYLLDAFLVFKNGGNG